MSLGTTGLMVAVDATCSGLQILAGLARDRSTAELVNVVPNSKPSDAYKAVADKAKEFLPSYMHHWMDRSVCKRTVMTIYQRRANTDRQCCISKYGQHSARANASDAMDKEACRTLHQKWC